MIQDSAQPIDIDGRGQLPCFPGGLFRCHVVGRTKNRRGESKATVLIERFGQTEICDVRLTLQIHEDVRRLQITMQDAALMSVMNRAANFDEQPDALA
jgi:hypothetical protein